MATKFLSTTLEQLTDITENIFPERDAFTNQFYLVKNTYPVLCILGLYYVQCLVLPMIMRRMPALDRAVHYPMQFYNLAMVLVNAYIFYLFVRANTIDLTDDAPFTIWCSPAEYDDRSPRTMNVRWATVIMLYSKFIELIDTTFFILRKKFNQVTFLHVYHHSSVIFMGLITSKSYPTGEVYFMSAANALVHVIMYYYYFLCGMGIRPWWKKYLTKMQLVQFVADLIKWAIAVWVFPCGFPKRGAYFLMGYITSILLLFVNFYVQTYLRGKSDGRKELSTKKANGHLHKD